MKLRTITLGVLAAALVAMPMSASAHGHHGGLIFGLAALGVAAVATTVAIVSAPFNALAAPAYYPPPPAPAYYSQPAPAYGYGYGAQPSAYPAPPAYYGQSPAYYPTPQQAYYPQPVYYAPQYYSYR